MPGTPPGGGRTGQRPPPLTAPGAPQAAGRARRNSLGGLTPTAALGIPAVPGAYILILRLIHPQRIRIGRLGLLRFASGRYAYVGSACGPGGLRARISHHLRAAARPHWHIDHLRAAAGVAAVWFAAGDRRLETLFAQILDDHRTHFSPVAGFGASDSRDCTHLFRIQRKAGANWFAQRLRPLFSETRLLRWLPSD